MVTCRKRVGQANVEKRITVFLIFNSLKTAIFKNVFTAILLHKSRNPKRCDVTPWLLYRFYTLLNTARHYVRLWFSKHWSRGIMAFGK
jgi:hypothetical protein